MTNNETILQLESLEKDYVSGHTQNILYRIALVPWLLNDISNCDKDVIDSYYQWFDVNEKFNLEIIESLIHMFKTDGRVMGCPISIYANYPEYLNRVVQWIVGKDSWRPSEKAHATATKLSYDWTAAVLNNLLD